MPAGPLPARNRPSSAPTPPARRQPPERLEALLRDLGPQLQAGKALQETRQPRNQAIRHASGIEGIDELLEGGFPRGELGEITGPASSGRTSLGFALLARTTDDEGRPRELAARFREGGCLRADGETRSSQRSKPRGSAHST